MAEYIIGLDQGSTNSKAVLADRRGNIVRQTVAPVLTRRPRAGWAEHSPDQLWRSQLEALRTLLRSIGKRNAVAALGIANQRSTILFWDRTNGRALTSAVSWQDLRAADLTRRWAERGGLIRSRTGLLLAPYYAAPKLRWLLDHTPGLRAKAERGSAVCGTVNSFLVWRLTRGEVHATDPSNAARTLLMDLKTLKWDGELLEIFGIPSNILPGILPTAADYGTAHLEGRAIPIRASIGDQQAGLIGIGAVRPGEVLVNYGTGGFFLANTGPRLVSVPGLLSSVAWTTPDARCYVVEGTVNAVGPVFEDFIRREWFSRPEEIDRIVKSVRTEMILIPAPNGLGAPHWLPDARTACFGPGPATTRADLIRAAVEGIAFLVKDIAETMRASGRVRIDALVAAGGGSRIDALLQAQADCLGIPIRRSAVSEATALGAARLAGVGCGWWPSPADAVQEAGGRVFRPRLSGGERVRRYSRWKRAIEAVRTFYGGEGIRRGPAR